MTTALATPTTSPRRPERRLTLEERLDLSLAAVRSTGAAQCPVCEGRMQLADATARCRDCGSSLA